MTKLRRKADIRKRVAAELAAMKAEEAMPRDWRSVFLDALLKGASAEQAARIAGVSRSRAYEERLNREFDNAWYSAQWMRRYGVRDLSVRLWPPSIQRRD